MAQLGILVEKVTAGRMEGCLVSTSAGVCLEGDMIKVQVVVQKKRFELRLGEKNVLTVSMVLNFDEAHEIGLILSRIGYKNVVILFNDKEYKINS